MCTVETISSNNSIIENGHLRSSIHLFHFGEIYNEIYLGRTVVRGIVCDHWYTNFTITQGGRQLFLVLEYYFAVSEWKIRDSHAWRIPVRAELFGYPISNFTHRPNMRVKELHRIFDFTDYQPSKSIIII